MSTNQEEEIKNATKTIKSGGLIVFPTDTIWGIGCDATNFDAVKNIYRLKMRDESKSMIVLVADLQQLNRHVNSIPPMALELIKYASKPLTLIYDNAKGFAANLYAPDGSIGIRITHHPFCNALLQQSGKPIVATSANLSGMPFPSSFTEINDAVLKGVDYVVNLQQKEKSLNNPSTIIRIDHQGKILILRK